MKKLNLFGLGAAAILGLALIAPVAHAQQKAPEQKPAAAAPAAPAAAKKADKKPASVCKGLEQAACGANTACAWRAEAEIKKGARKGQKVKAHCRANTPPPTKKAAAPAGTKAPVSAPAATKAPTTATPPPSSAGPAKK